MSSKTQQKKQEMCCECGIEIGVVHGMCNRQHLFCRKCTENHLNEEVTMAGIKNTYCGVIVVFGLISVNMRSVQCGYSMLYKT